MALDVNQKIDQMQAETRAQFSQFLADMQEHNHNGTNSNRIRIDNIEGRKLFVHHTLYGATAATAANYGVFWIAPVKCVLSKFQEVHQTAGTDGSAVTLVLEKLSGTDAPGAGDDMTSSLSLKATANTVQEATLSSTAANLTMAPGDRLCLKDSGTLTSLANVTVLAELNVII